MAGVKRGRSLVASFAKFALALVLPLVLMTAVATRWYVESERARLGTVVHMAGERLREAIERDLAELAGVARALAHSPAIDRRDFAELHARFLTLIESGADTITLTELGGRQLVNTRVPPGEPMPVVARPKLEASLRPDGKPVVSGLLISALSGRRIIGVNVPVVRDGVVRSYLSVTRRLEHLEHLLDRQGIAEPFSAAILDGEGHVIAMTPGARIAEAWIEQTKLAAEDVAREPVASLSPFGDGVVGYQVKSDLSGWTILTGVDRAALEKPLSDSMFLFLGLGFVLCGIGGGIAWRWARRITAGAAALVAAARAIGRGEKVELPPLYLSESNAVGRALVDASQLLEEQRRAIAAAHATLEERVAERTRELEASRLRYEVLAENLADVIVLRQQGALEIGYVSPSCERVFGFHPDYARTMPLEEVIHPDDLAEIRGGDLTLSPARPCVTTLFRAKRKDGRWIWVECASSLVATTDGAPPNIVSVLRDVTERQEQAEALRIARDTAELAQAKAENASRAKTDFLAVVSQEIRTPLATISGIGELLAESEPLSSEQRRYVGFVAEAAAAMQAAVDDILDFARVEAGDIQLDPMPFALARMLDHVVAQVRGMAARKGVSLGLNGADRLPPLVMGDERRLNQILRSLLTAMVRARRGGLVTLSVQHRPGPGGESRLAFVLTGDGGQVVSKDHGGLGVTIARRLVALMGGQLEAAKGASRYAFSLGLPVVAQAPDPVPVEAATPGRPGSARLLVAEDHPVNQEIVRAILERAGFAVDVVSDGVDALAAVQQRNYDLVLMDVQMPGMDGMTATRRIRALQHPARRIPIIAMTANVMPDQVRALREAGMDAHVAKPFDRHTLCAAVYASLSSLMLVDAASDAPAPPAVFDRTVYDRLCTQFDPGEVRGFVGGFVTLLDLVQGDEVMLRARSPAIAVGARQLGFLDLAEAHDQLAQAGDEASAAAALSACRVAHGLACRVLDELTTTASPEIAANVVLL